MMKKRKIIRTIWTTLISLLCSVNLSAQLENYNITLKGSLSLANLHGGSDISDIWGYTDETGIEYALVGVNEGGLSVISLEDPTNPIQVFFAPAPNSTWRDVKTYGDFAFVTNESDGGLQVIDLSPLPEDPPSNVFFYNQNGNYSSAHNIFIDELGYAYVFGAHIEGTFGPEPTLILDVSDPSNIHEVGRISNFYAHDGMVRNDTLFLAHINDGFFAIVDVQDRSNPVFIATQMTPSLFTHNLWVSDNGKSLFTTDERSSAYLASYDISDPFHIRELDRVRSLRNSSTIIHNTTFKNDFLITSYYRDGVTIHDATDPANLMEVGHFDTSPLEGNGFNGAWGVYPYFESGLIIVSDIEEGLFVLEPNYNRGIPVVGMVYNAQSGNEIPNVRVRWQTYNMVEYTQQDGSFKTGVGMPGSYMLEFSKLGYVTKNVPFELLNDTLFLDVELEPENTFNLIVNLVGLEDPDGVEVKLVSDGQTELILGSSNVTFEGLVPAEYTLYVGKWGYKSEVVVIDLLDDNRTLDIRLDKGYRQDGNLDLGFTGFTSGEGAAFVRGEPVPTKVGSAFFVSPDWDSEADEGNQGFFTGNMNTNVEANDLDDISDLNFPEFFTQDGEEWRLFFDLWFFESEAGLGHLECVVEYPDTSWAIPITIESGQEWNEKSISFLARNGSVQLKLRATAERKNAVVDFGIDHIRLFPLVNLNVNQAQFKVVPNPVSDIARIDLDDDQLDGLLPGYFVDLAGRRISFNLELVAGIGELDLTVLPSGMYVVQLEGVEKTGRIVKVGQ